MRRPGTAGAIVAVVVAVALAAAACGDDGATGDGPPAEGTTSTRPPLDSPPDPGPVPDHDGLTDDVRARVVGSTARVSGVACGSVSEGSGFAVADELLVTSAHVIVGLDEVRVDLPDGRRVVGEPVAFDAVADLALLRVEGAGLDPLPLGDADDGTIGALIGWEPDPAPEATPFRIDRPITVRIEAVGTDERIERPSWLVAADIEAGDSGGPLVDPTGTVVGIAYATTTRDAGVGYAVRAGELEELIAAGLTTAPVVPGC